MNMSFGERGRLNLAERRNNVKQYVSAARQRLRTFSLFDGKIQVRVSRDITFIDEKEIPM